MKKVLICQLVLIVSVTIFIGCTSSDTGIVGKWQSGPPSNDMYMFYEDNTCARQSFNMAFSGKCKWTKLKDGQYEIEWTNRDGEIFTFPLEVDGDVLSQSGKDAAGEWTIKYKRLK
jgi:hypothetical protein